MATAYPAAPPVQNFPAGALGYEWSLALQVPVCNVMALLEPEAEETFQSRKEIGQDEEPRQWNCRSWLPNGITQMSLSHCSRRRHISRTVMTFLRAQELSSTSGLIVLFLLHLSVRETCNLFLYCIQPASLVRKRKKNVCAENGVYKYIFDLFIHFVLLSLFISKCCLFSNLPNGSAIPKCFW